jgi:tRNA-Thr(GGU) m(6)t(6)A37 methyltransferase TsaA
MSGGFMVEPIGYVSSTRKAAIDDDWDSITAAITLEPRFTSEALQGLQDFSHLEVVFVFDQVDEASIQTKARHPRSNPDWPQVGIFAQRAKMRPNRIGVSVCRLLSVDGVTLTVAALDAIDGTPVLDLKPVMAEFAPRGPVRQPAWSHELMAGYWQAPQKREQR